jgi:hypothetical protein
MIQLRLENIVPDGVLELHKNIVLDGVSKLPRSSHRQN